MPSLKLNKRSVERIAVPDPSGNQVLHWDTELKGFGLLASGKTCAKTYIVQRRLNDGRMRRLTIGPATVFDTDKAREIAQAQLGEMFLGKDPKAQGRSKNQVTLRTGSPNISVLGPALRESTRRNYRKTVEKQLEDWLDRPVLSINSEMVMVRHRDIQKAIASREATRLKTSGDEPGALWSTATPAPIVLCEVCGQYGTSLMNGHVEPIPTCRQWSTQLAS